MDEVLKENVEFAGYKVPTPVQKYAVPIVTAGRDLMACAQTGTLDGTRADHRLTHVRVSRFR